MKQLVKPALSRTFLISLVALSMFLFFMPTSTFASSTVADAEVSAASNWIVSNQQSNGGFELAGFDGFETADAVLAIATAAQTSTTYDKSLALAKVLSTTKGPKTPLDYLDAFTATNNTAANACKLIVNVVSPLGLNATDFDPSDDSPTAVDLLALVNSSKLGDGSFGVGVLNTTLTCALALFLETGSVPADTLSYLESTQAKDGSFNFAGDSSILDGGADTTGLAIEVLVAAERNIEDSSLMNAVSYLASTINADGSFSSFGTPDPNSTAFGLRALNAAGIDSELSSWRDFFASSKKGTAYTSPSSWLVSQQTSDGNFASPYDSFGINTFATSQVAVALSAKWFPIRSLSTFVPTIQDNVVPPPVVRGETVSKSAAKVSIAGELAETGSESSDMAIIGTVVLVLGLVAVLLSKKKKK